jgi:hypothetical protein
MFYSLKQIFFLNFLISQALHKSSGFFNAALTYFCEKINFLLFECGIYDKKSKIFLTLFFDFMDYDKLADVN